MEDLAQGIGKVVQNRVGKQFTLGKVNIPYAVLSEEGLKDIDVSKFMSAMLNGLTYKYDEDDNSGIPPLVGKGSWILDPRRAMDVALDSGETLQSFAMRGGAYYNIEHLKKADLVIGAVVDVYLGSTYDIGLASGSEDFLLDNGLGAFSRNNSGSSGPSFEYINSRIIAAFSNVDNMLAGITNGGEPHKFEAGQYLCSGGTIWLVKSVAQPMTLANLEPKNNVYVDDFYKTSDTQAFVDASAFCKTYNHDLFGKNRTYTCTGQGTVDLVGIGISILGTINFVNGTDYLVIGGNASSTQNPKQFIRNVLSDTDRTIDTPVLKVHGAKNQHIEVEVSPSIMLFADNADNRLNYSIAYSDFHFNYVKYLWLKGEVKGTSAQAGWINENTFNINRMTLCRIGIDDVDSYSHNNNRFKGGTLEGATRHIEIIAGSNNTFYDIRFESAGEDTILFGERTYKNRVYISWVSSQADDPVYDHSYIDKGIGNIVGSTDEAMFSVSNLADISASTLLFDVDESPTVCNYANIGVWASAKEEETEKVSPLTVSKVGNKLRAKQWCCIYRSSLVPVSPTGDTWITVDSDGWEPTAGLRLFIYGYDKDGTLLATTSKDVYVKGVGDVPFGTTVGVNSKSVSVNIVRRDCRFVRAVISNGSVESNFDYIKMSTRSPKTSDIQDELNYKANPATKSSIGMIPNLDLTKFKALKKIEDAAATTLTFKVPIFASLEYKVTFTYAGGLANNCYRKGMLLLGNSAGEVEDVEISNKVSSGGAITASALLDSEGTHWVVSITKPAGTGPYNGVLSFVVDSSHDITDKSLA